MKLVLRLTTAVLLALVSLPGPASAAEPLPPAPSLDVLRPSGPRIDYHRPFPEPTRKTVEPLLLRARYAKGEQFTVVVTETSDDALTTYGPKEVTEASRTEKEVTSRWDVVDVLPNGDARVVVHYEHFAARLVKGGVVAAVLDSRQPPSSDVVKKMLAVMRKPFTVALSSRARIVAVTGLDEILDDWRAEAETTLSAEKRQELDWVVEGLLGQENAAKTLSEALTPFPDTPLDRARTWTETLAWPTEFATMTGTRTFRLAEHPSVRGWHVVSEDANLGGTSNDKRLELETVRAVLSSRSTINADSGRLVLKTSTLDLDLKLYGTPPGGSRTLLARTRSTATTRITMRPALNRQASTLFDQGAALARRRDYRAAIQELDRAIGVQPGVAELFTHRGAARHALGDLEGAAKDFEAAIRLDPGFEAAYFGRAAARVDLKDYAGARADHTTVIELAPHYWRSFLLRGILHTMERNWQAAIADLTEAIARNPEVPEAYRFRGDSYRHQGNAAAAEADFKKWVELGGGRR